MVHNSSVNIIISVLKSQIRPVGAFSVRLLCVCDMLPFVFLTQQNIPGSSWTYSTLSVH